MSMHRALRTHARHPWCQFRHWTLCRIPWSPVQQRLGCQPLSSPESCQRTYPHGSPEFKLPSLSRTSSSSSPTSRLTSIDNGVSSREQWRPLPDSQYPRFQRCAAAALAAAAQQLQLRRPLLTFGEGSPIRLVTNHFLLEVVASPDSAIWLAWQVEFPTAPVSSLLAPR